MAKIERNDAHILLDDFLDKYRDLKASIDADNKLLRENFSEMKAQGFDVKVLRQLAKLATETKAQKEKRAEQEAILELYKDATNLE